MSDLSDGQPSTGRANAPPAAIPMRSYQMTSMPLVLTDDDFLEDPEREVAALERLAVDLRRIASGARPNDQELSTAPLIDGWQLAGMVSPCLTGKILGRPLLCGPSIETSQVWALAPKLRWARTMSRWYRLGRPPGRLVRHSWAAGQHFETRRSASAEMTADHSAETAGVQMAAFQVLSVEEIDIATCVGSLTCSSGIARPVGRMRRLFAASPNSRSTFYRSVLDKVRDNASRSSGTQ